MQRGNLKGKSPARAHAVVRDNKKCFYKYINKKRAKESLHRLRDARGNIVNQDEEKAEVLHAFFASVFNSQASYSQESEPPLLEDKEGVWNKPPIIQEEAVNDLLCHLGAYKSMGPDGIHLTVPRDLAEELAKPLSIILAWIRNSEASRSKQGSCPCTWHW